MKYKNIKRESHRLSLKGLDEFENIFLNIKSEEDLNDVRRLLLDSKTSTFQLSEKICKLKNLIRKMDKETCKNFSKYMSENIHDLEIGKTDFIRSICESNDFIKNRIDAIEEESVGK